MTRSRARCLEENEIIGSIDTKIQGDVSKSRNLPWIADEYTHFFSSWIKDRDSSYFFRTTPFSHATIAALTEPEKHEAYQKQRENWLFWFPRHHMIVNASKKIIGKQPLT